MSDRSPCTIGRQGTRQTVSCEVLEDRLMLFANNDFLSGIFASVQAPIHEDITIQGLSAATLAPVIAENYARSYLNDATIRMIVKSVVDQDLGVIQQSSHFLHFDNSNFFEGAQRINTEYEIAVKDASPASFDPAGAAVAFGAALHTIEDFYSHSNWVNMGMTQLVSSGLGFWGTNNSHLVQDTTAIGFRGYSTRRGAVLLEGTTLPANIKAVVHSKTDPTKIGVLFTNGTRAKGIITGFIDGVTAGAPDMTPAAVAVPHDELDHDWGSPDYTGPVKARPLFAQARSLAVQQVAHEFQRLGSLIVANFGENALCKLVHAWVKNDTTSMKAADAALHDNPCVLKFIPKSGGFPAYNIIDLGTINGDPRFNSSAYAINDNGQVVGYSATNGATDAFLYANGSMTDLGRGEAFGIDSLGNIVGQGDGGAFNTTGTITKSKYFITSTNASDSIARGIAGGIVVGGFDAPNNYRHAFSASGGAVKDLGTLGGQSSLAFGVNSSGEVIGIADGVPDVFGNSVSHAFASVGGSLQELSSIKAIGSLSSTAQAINANGLIVGSIHVVDISHHSTPEVAAVWTSPTAAPILIGKLHTSVGAVADAVNDSGWVVGYSFSTGDIGHPFIWRQGGKPVLLSSLLTGFSSWKLDQVAGINNLGQIVGIGFPPGGDGSVEHAFILEPVLK